MDNATIIIFNKHLLTAKEFLKSSNEVLTNLAHYIADNGIAKIMMLKLHEEKNYPIKSSKTKKGVEDFKFPPLVGVFMKEFPSIKLDYGFIIKQHQKARNPFQHHLSTTYLVISKDHAEEYVSEFQKLLEELGIIRKDIEFSLDIAENRQIITEDPREAITFFIEKLKQSEFESILTQFNTTKFRRIILRLFTKNKIRLDHVKLWNSSYIIVIGVEEILVIQSMPHIKKEFGNSWGSKTTNEKLQLWLEDFKKRVKEVYSIGV